MYKFHGIRTMSTRTKARTDRQMEIQTQFINTFQLCTKVLGSNAETIKIFLIELTYMLNKVHFVIAHEKFIIENIVFDYSTLNLNKH